jgi:hypothetical protein
MEVNFLPELIEQLTESTSVALARSIERKAIATPSVTTILQQHTCIKVAAVHRYYYYMASIVLF